MEIITTYFANLKNLPDGFVPVAISIGQPVGVSIAKCPDLYPRKSLLDGYKAGTISWEDYVLQYSHYTLGPLKREVLLQQLQKYFGDKIALVCWEGKLKDCHRHIVADWIGNVREL